MTELDKFTSNLMTVALAMFALGALIKVVKSCISNGVQQGLKQNVFLIIGIIAIIAILLLGVFWV